MPNPTGRRVSANLLTASRALASAASAGIITNEFRQLIETRHAA